MSSRIPTLRLPGSALFPTIRPLSINEVLNTLPQNDLIVRMFRIALEKRLLTEENRLTNYLDEYIEFLDFSTLQTEAERNPGPIYWQFATGGDLYLSFKIQKEGSPEIFIQGFIFDIFFNSIRCYESNEIPFFLDMTKDKEIEKAFTDLMNEGNFKTPEGETYILYHPEPQNKRTPEKFLSRSY